MPPKKKNSPAVSSPYTQANKRTGESLLHGLAKRQKHADDANPNDKRNMDSYCWICHQSEKDINCKDCQRVYHTLCLDKVSLEFSNDICPECQLKSHNNGNRKGFLTEDKLREILNVAATEFRKKFKSSDKMMFFQWPNIEDSELVRIIDFDLLEDNIKDENHPYQCLAEIVSDIKWIHHNYCILDGVDSPLAKEAEGFVRMFQKEITDIEDCPKCYYHMFVERRKDDFFVKICDPPHDIVWAWLKGSSPWPAKCLRVENGKAHVRFFGTHDKSNIPIGNKKCLSISLNHPTHKHSKLTDENLVPKKKEYKIAVNELLVYIDRFERKFGKKFKYYEAGTPYKCETIKPSRKKKNRDRRNVSTVTNPVESVSLSHSESVLTDPEGNQSYSSPIEVDITIVDENVHDGPEVESRFLALLAETGLDSLDYAAETVLDSAEDFSEGNVPIPSSSPVVTASMVCEVASDNDVQTTYSNLFSAPAVYSRLISHADTSLSQSNFQPLASCSSTPIATSSASNQWNAISMSRSHSVLSDRTSALLQDEFRRDKYADPQQMHLDSEVLPARNTPFNITSTSVSESIDCDDDVIFLRSTRPSRTSNLDPSAILPYIFSGNPDLQSLFRDGRYVFDSLFIRCWAFANRFPQAPELITKLMEELKKLNSEKNKLIREKEVLEQNNCINENEVLRQQVTDLTDENNSLKMRLEEKKKRILTLEDYNQKAIDNANDICSGLNRTYAKKFEGANVALVRKMEGKLNGMSKELDSKHEELQQLNRDLEGKETFIKELKSSLQLFKEETTDLRAKNEEAKEAYTAKLEELLKLQREKMSWETNQEVKGMVNRHLKDLELAHSQRQSSSVPEFHEQNLPSNIYDSFGVSPKKSSRSSSAKSPRTPQRRISQEVVETIARKTSVNIQLSKTITTTRNEGNAIAYHRPPALYAPPHFSIPTPAILYPIMAPIIPHGAVFCAPSNDSIPTGNNTAFDLSQHASHRESQRYYAHSPSTLLPPAHGRDRHYKETRKRSSRYPHHDQL